MKSNDEARAKQRRHNLILLNVCVGQFIVGLDQRALLVALPTLTHTFHTSLTTIQWVLLIYDLLLIGTVITVGRLGDLFGRRRFYAAGFLVFVLGSALCGVAQSAWQIILFRGLQAVGGAMISANGRAVASVVFPASERGKAMGFASMAFHVGFLTGPTVGGILIDTIGWRWIFYLNLPIGIWGAYLAWKLLEESREDVQETSVDFPGAILLMATYSLFLYAMNQLPHVGWRDSSVAVLLILSMLAGALFVFVELRSRMPILSFSLFRNRLFTASMLSLFFITSTQSAISFLMPFYLQNILHFSPTHMGWILIANSVVIVMVAPIAGWLSDRMGSRLLCTVGSGLIVIGQFFVASLGIDSSIPRIIFPLLLIGLGWAIFNSPNQSAILGSVPRDKLGTASGMNTTAARTGGAMGVALSATLFTYGLASAGLTRAQVESPQSWGEAPEIFVHSFNHTVHLVNIFTLLSVFFSAVRGRRQE
ncbi:MAG TPA: MFS transporter [Candidatus Binatia bacterium]|jgi:EmrB/QacA subfamily drug resistance transporter